MKVEHLTKQTLNVNNDEARQISVQKFPRKSSIWESKAGLPRIMEFQKEDPISKYGYLPCYKVEVQEATKVSNVRWPKNPTNALVETWFVRRAYEIPTISHRSFHAYETTRSP